MVSRCSRPLGGLTPALACLVFACGTRGSAPLGPVDASKADAEGASDDGRGDEATRGGGLDDAWAAPDVGTPIEAGSPGPVDVDFEIHADQGAHRISPYVYGVNDGNQAAPHHATIVRTGGNRLTAYDWENNASNAGSDYLFENDDFLCATMGKSNAYPCAPSNDSPGAYLKAVVDQAVAAGAASLVTVPIVDYVAADKSPGGDVRLGPDGGPAADYLAARFDKNEIKGGSFQYPPDPNDGVVYQDEMVSWLARAEPAAVLRFDLDNEPDLWSSTHAEVHPSPVTYAEIAERNVRFAAAIHAVLPGAEVWGPVSYGWAGYVSLQGAPDSTKDGDFLDWWLDQMAAAQADAGAPLVSGMDLHWYPEVGDAGGTSPSNGGPAGSDCRIVSDPTTDSSLPADCYTAAGAAGAAAAREQAPRSLWDATYVENSWIPTTLGNGAIALIPRLKAKIAAHDPPMKLGFSEWNYGGGADVSGAIAAADVLGVFGAYGVDMAMLWEVWHDESFTYAAFDAYRDYDGRGGTFGDTSIGASTNDATKSSVYASLRSDDPTALVIVAINKALDDLTAGIVIHHSTRYATARVYTITQAGGAALVAAAPLSTVATNAFAYRMPAQSVSVIVPAP